MWPPAAATLCGTHDRARSAAPSGCRPSLRTRPRRARASPTTERAGTWARPATRAMSRAHLRKATGSAVGRSRARRVAAGTRSAHYVRQSIARRPGLSRPSPIVQLPSVCHRGQESHGGNRRLPPHSYRRALVNLFAFDAAHPYESIVDQLLEVRPQRHLRRDHQLTPQLRPVHAARQLRRGAATAPHLAEHLGFAIKPVHAVFLQLAHCIGNGVPVTWKENSWLERCHALERAQVCGHVTLRVGHHRAATTKHEISRE